MACVCIYCTAQQKPKNKYEHPFRHLKMWSIAEANEILCNTFVTRKPLSFEMNAVCFWECFHCHSRNWNICFVIRCANCAAWMCVYSKDERGSERKSKLEKVNGSLKLCLSFHSCALLVWFLFAVATGRTSSAQFCGSFKKLGHLLPVANILHGAHFEWNRLKRPRWFPMNEMILVTLMGDICYLCAEKRASNWFYAFFTV